MYITKKQSTFQKNGITMTLIGVSGGNSYTELIGVHLTMEYDITIALMERIRSLCAKRGITPGELSKLSGVNLATIYEVLGGRSKHPSIKTVRKIANAFDMSLSKFFDDPVFMNIDA